MNILKKTLFACLCLLIAGSLFAGGQQSEKPVGGGWRPTRPVNILCNSAAGGGTDITARTLAQVFEQVLGQPFQVTNVTGGSGGIAMHQIWNGPHDGYTILGTSVMMHSTAIAEVFPHTTDVWDLFIACGSPGILSVNADSPYKTFDDLIAAAKTTEIKVAASNPVSVWAIKFAQIQKLLGPGYKFNFLSYTGSGPSNVALLSNEVDIAVTAAGEQLQYIQSGKFRPLVAVEAEDVDIPGYGTVKSLVKLFPEYVKYPAILPWTGIAVPKDVPPEVLAAYREAFAKALESDVFKKVMKDMLYSEYGLYGEAAAEKAKELDSTISWAVYDTGLVKISPEKFNIPKP
jgi:tripartite-type tricarboxylate transporter receptor subunit TctC